MKLLSTVNHDGVTYEAGSSIPEGKISKEQLKALQDAGAVDAGKGKTDEDEDTTDDDTDIGDEVNADKLSKTRLLEIAEERGVEVEETQTKAEIAEAINNAPKE